MALLLQTSGSGLIGAAALAAVSFFDIESWPLFMAELAHYIVVMAVFVPVAWYLDWISNSSDILIFALIMALADLTIFLIMCAVYRAQVRELNEMQKVFLRKL